MHSGTQCGLSARLSNHHSDLGEFHGRMWGVGVEFHGRMWGVSVELDSRIWGMSGKFHGRIWGIMPWKKKDKRNEISQCHSFQNPCQNILSFFQKQ